MSNTNIDKFREFVAKVLRITLIITAIVTITTQNYQQYLEDYSCPSFSYKKNNYSVHYQGVVMRKYSDMSNHGIYTLKITTIKGEIKLLFLPLVEFNTPLDKRLWDYVEGGDSVFKRKDEYKITVKKVYETREFDIDCDEFKKRLKK